MSDNITITCYPEMDKKIIELLRMRGDAISRYVAQRIKDLEEARCHYILCPDFKYEQSK